MSTNDEDFDSRIRRYKSVAMSQLVNLTGGKMEADLRAYYDRLEAAASNPNGDTKEGWQAFKKACLALLDRLKVWHTEFQKLQVGEGEVDAECVRTVDKILSEIREDIDEVVDIHNEAAQRRIAAMHEQERREIEKGRRELDAYITEHGKTMNKMNREFTAKVRELRSRRR